jgi:hypothetical protein
MITFDPATTKKPNYIEAFDMIGALPSEIKQGVRHLLLRIWKHTNSNASHPLFGKAWMSHERLEREMGCTNVNDLFDRAEALGIVGREHLFKKADGKTVVSDQPYRKGTNKGMGEYIGSRYWINWEKVKELAAVAVAENATPTENGASPENGVAKKATPIGVAENATPKESMTSTEIGVAESATGIAENATKGLIEGSPQTLHPPEATEAASDAPAESSPTREREETQNKNPDDDAEKPKTCGQKHTISLEARSNGAIDSLRAKQLDRHAPAAEIKHHIQNIFDRVAQEANLRERKGGRAITLEPGSVLKTSQSHWTALVDLYRTVGGAAVAAKWEEYLVQDDHDVTEPVEDDGGRRTTQDVQRTYLLHHFLEKYDYALRHRTQDAA